MSSTSADVKSVKGNASDEIKEFVLNILRQLIFKVNDTKGFSDSIGARIKVTEVSIHPKESFPKKQEATVVCELDVNQGWQFDNMNPDQGCLNIDVTIV
jgi:hypothetical protein